MTRTATTAKAVTRTPVLCGCGCGNTTRGHYAPGHDARHAGFVAQALAVTTGQDLRATLLGALPSAALQAKAIAAAERLVARNAKAAKPRVRTSSTVTGTVKVGRWVYPARKLAGGEVVRNTKRDGSGEWTRVEGVEFAA